MLLLAIALQATPAEFCGKFSNTDCGNCINNMGNFSCGYCLESKSCVPGDSQGPFVGTCNSWYNTMDSVCKKDSSLALSNIARICICAFAFCVSVSLIVFWVWFSPKVLSVNAKTPELL